MKQSKFIKNLIIDEVNKLNEACGGGCGGGPEPMGITIGSHDPEPLTSYELGDESEELLSKEEALEMVAKIAAITSCPVTQSALMGTVEDLNVDEDMGSYDSLGNGYDEESGNTEDYNIGGG